MTSVSQTECAHKLTIREYLLTHTDKAESILSASCSKNILISMNFYVHRSRFKKIIAMTVATSRTYLCLPDMQPMTQHKQVS